MAAAQDAGNNGGINDLWSFLDRGLDRAGDVFDQYVRWDAWQTNKEIAETRADYLRNLPISGRGNGIPGSTTGKNDGGYQQPIMAGGISPMMIGMGAVALYLIASR